MQEKLHRTVGGSGTVEEQVALADNHHESSISRRRFDDTILDGDGEDSENEGRKNILKQTGMVSLKYTYHRNRTDSEANGTCVAADGVG